MRVAAAADFGNGISGAVTWDEHLFINPDLTIYLHRLPAGDWIGLDARTWPTHEGVGIADTALLRRGRSHRPFGPGAAARPALSLRRLIRILSIRICGSRMASSGASTARCSWPCFRRTRPCRPAGWPSTTACRSPTWPSTCRRCAAPESLAPVRGRGGGYRLARPADRDHGARRRRGDRRRGAGVPVPRDPPPRPGRGAGARVPGAVRHPPGHGRGRRGVAGTARAARRSPISPPASCSDASPEDDSSSRDLAPGGDVDEGVPDRRYGRDRARRRCAELLDAGHEVRAVGATDEKAARAACARAPSRSPSTCSTATR